MIKYKINYEECNENFKEELDLQGSTVKISSGISYENLKLAKAIMEIGGEVSKVIHYRNRDHVDYYTLIYQEDIGKIVIDGGLTSGYVGSGTSSFKMLLTYLGIQEDEAEEIAVRKNNALDIAKIEINFY